jgi:hypothetical protein
MVKVALVENHAKSHAARTDAQVSNTQCISSKEGVLVQVVNVKFCTPREIPTSFLWIDEIGNVEIFVKS